MKSLKARQGLSAFSLVGLVFLFQNCDGKFKTMAPAITPESASLNFIDGEEFTSSDLPSTQKSLYAENCSQCHGALTISTLKNVGLNLTLVKKAINEVPSMAHLKVLSDDDIQSILHEFGATSVNEPLKLCEAPSDLPSGALFRLTKTQYANVLNDLFGLNNGLSYLSDWPTDTVSGSFENNGLGLEVNEILLTALMVSSEKLVDDVFANASKKAIVLNCSLSQPACAQKSLKSFLDRAFKRPVAPSDVNNYLSVYNEVLAAGDTSDNAFKVSLQAILVSPSFLYNAYVFGETLPNGRKQLNPMELAHRLSFMLWGRLPDAALLNAAQNGSLATPSGLSQQVKRMLKSPQSVYFSRSFFDAWLIPSRFINSSSSFYHLSDENLKASMLQETKTFFDHLVSQDSKLTDLLTKGGDGVGILSQASILALTGRDKAELNVIHRGKWVMDRLLCQGPPPPVNREQVNQIADGQLKDGFTVRDMANFRIQNVSCATCHQGMDQFGFTLQDYDSFGRKVTMGTFPIDDLGKMPTGEEVSGPTGLRDWLLRQDAPKGCFGKRLSAFAFGRTLNAPDICVANRLGVENWNQTLSQWIVNVVNSDGFQEVK